MSIQPVNFSRSCIKTLSAVETDPTRSNQREFNGVAPLKIIFGEERYECTASFSRRGDALVVESHITWYDAREAHATRSEFRLYFQPNPVMNSATAGDNIVIGFGLDGNVHCELIPRVDPTCVGKFSEWTVQK